MILGDEPGPVRQDFVDFVKISKFGRDAVQTLQPALVAALRHKFVHLLLDQVGALVTSRRLIYKKKYYNLNPIWFYFIKFLMDTLIENLNILNFYLIK